MTRHCVGVMFICAAKTRPKCDESLNPQAKAMSVVVRHTAFGDFNRPAARFTRSSNTRRMIVSLREAKLRASVRVETLRSLAILAGIKVESANLNWIAWQARV